jgi:hypothetical protein
VHAVLRPGAAAPETALREALAAGGIVVDGLERVIPSLDDVFLDVVDRAASAGGPA